MNFSDAGVVETSRMFQAAVAAFQSPGARPTRGSGLGALTDMSGVGAVLPAIEIAAGEVAQPPSAANASRMLREREDTDLTVTPVGLKPGRASEADGASNLHHLTAKRYGSATAGRTSDRRWRRLPRAAEFAPAAGLRLWR